MASSTDLIEFLNGVEPGATTGPSSQIDETIPVYGNPTTASVRANFATAKTEISALMAQTVGSPFMPIAGGNFGGPIYLYNDPTDKMMPVTLQYAEANFGVAGGSPSIPEAPTDGKFYLRSQGAWAPGVALSGGTLSQMTGELLLAGDPTDALGAVTKQYADAISTVANAAVKRAGDTMTGLLLLSGDPTAPLGAATKQYTDAGLALKGNAANPSFTGTVAVSSRVTISGTDGGSTCPALTLYDTTASPARPCFGVYNNMGYLSFGLATPSSGNPNGNPFATMDQTGAWSFAGKVTASTGRLISSLSGANPSITVNRTDGSQPWCVFTDGTNLGFATADANGNIAGSWANLNASGTFTCGAVNAGGNSTFAGVSLTNPGNISAASNISAAGSVFSNGGALCSHTAENAQVTAWSDSYGRTGWFTGGSNVMYFCTFNADSSFVMPQRFSADSGGSMYLTGGLTQGSDERTKTNIEPIANCTDIIRALIPKSYQRAVEAGMPTHWGFVAQDVQECCPVAVMQMPVPEGDDSAPILGIEPMAILAAVTKALQEIDARLSTIEEARR